MTRASRRNGERGQSIVELAIFLPIVVVLFLTVGDLARAFATMITIESAAREAADWGAYRPPLWDTDATVTRSPDCEDSPLVYQCTVRSMERRACTAALSLPDYQGAADGSTCTNPSFECFVDTSSNPTSACTSPSTCDTDACRVKVVLGYDFDLLTPALVFLPTSFHFDRTSIFAVGKDQGVSP